MIKVTPQQLESKPLPQSPDAYQMLPRVNYRVNNHTESFARESPSVYHHHFCTIMSSSILLPIDTDYMPIRFEPIQGRWQQVHFNTASGFSVCTVNSSAHLAIDVYIFIRALSNYPYS